MEKASAPQVIMLVGAQCPPEADEEYNTWVDEKHIPEVMGFEGLLRATRYKLTNPEAEKAGYPRYLVVWEFEDEKAAKAYDESPHRAVVLEDFRKTLGNKGVQIKWRAHYEKIRTFEK